MYTCPECGSEVPDDSDFCYVCGRAKKKGDDAGPTGNIAFTPGMCAFCGGKVGFSDVFCEHCGKPINNIPQMMMFKPKMSKYGWIGIALALIPGFFNVFGLGHLFFRRWGRAGMYLLISVLFIYMTRFAVLSDFMEILVLLSSIFIYFMQAMEVFMLAFLPPKKTK